MTKNKMLSRSVFWTNILDYFSFLKRGLILKGISAELQVLERMMWGIMIQAQGHICALMYYARENWGASSLQSLHLNLGERSFSPVAA